MDACDDLMRIDAMPLVLQSKNELSSLFNFFSRAFMLFERPE